jgi:hypothetical protein
MSRLSPRVAPPRQSPEEADVAIADKMDPDTEADELLAEQIAEAQDSAT